MKMRMLFEAKDRHDNVESMNHAGWLISYPISLSYSEE